MIAIEGLKKRYGKGDLVLKDVSLTVAEGEFFTLLGPSGCGKTTLLRCIAGLEHAESGSIAIRGDKVFDGERAVMVPPNKRRIGMVFQSYAIWPHMSVLENVAFPAQAKRLADPAGLARKALAAVGLDHLADRSATRLSGGQQQRVALARALVGDPDVLLLDEPLSNLDAGLRERMRGELRRLQTEFGLTTVLVTHDQAEALSMSDRLAIMEHGVPVETGTPEEVYRRPRTAFAARFLGDTVELTGQLTSGTNGETLVETPLGTFEALSDTVVEGPRTVFLRTDELHLHASAPAGTPGFAVRPVQRRFIGGAYEYDVTTLAGEPQTFRICDKASYADTQTLFVEVTRDSVIVPLA